MSETGSIQAAPQRQDQLQDIIDRVGQLPPVSGAVVPSIADPAMSRAGEWVWNQELRFLVQAGQEGMRQSMSDTTMVGVVEKIYQTVAVHYGNNFFPRVKPEIKTWYPVSYADFFAQNGTLTVLFGGNIFTRNPERYPEVTDWLTHPDTPESVVRIGRTKAVEAAIHEYVHILQPYSDERVYQEALRVSQIITDSRKEASFKFLAINLSESARPDEWFICMTKAMIEEVAKKDSSMAEGLRAVVQRDAMRFSHPERVSWSKVQDFFFLESMKAWFGRPEVRLILGPYGEKNQRVLLGYLELLLKNAGANTRATETEAYQVGRSVVMGEQVPPLNSVTVRYAEVDSLGAVMDGQQALTTDPTMSAPPTITREKFFAIRNIINSPYFTGGINFVRGVGSGAGILGGAAAIYSSVTDEASNGWDYLFGTGGGAALMFSSAFDWTVMAVPKILSNPVVGAGSKFAGPVAWAGFTLLSAWFFVKDLRRPEVLLSEKIIAGAVVGVFATPLVVSSLALATSVTGPVVPAIAVAALPYIAVGSLGAGLVLSVAHTEAVENRVAAQLDEALAEVRDENKTDKLTAFLADTHQEIDDDALMDFFNEVADDDPSLINDALWARPELAPLREKIKTEFTDHWYTWQTGGEERWLGWVREQENKLP